MFSTSRLSPRPPPPNPTIIYPWPVSAMFLSKSTSNRLNLGNSSTRDLLDIHLSTQNHIPEPSPLARWKDPKNLTPSLSNDFPTRMMPFQIDDTPRQPKAPPRRPPPLPYTLLITFTHKALSSERSRYHYFPKRSRIIEKRTLIFRPPLKTAPPFFTLIFG